MFLDAPQGFRDPAILAARYAMLETVPSVQPLRDWAAALVARRGPETFLPHFDPAEAGVDARALIVAEAPGPMTATHGGRPGSGFVSVDNDDLSAANLWNLRAEAGLHDGVLLWNIVPWYLGPASVKPTARDLALGANALRELMDLMPGLRVVLHCGLMAQSGWDRRLRDYRANELVVVRSWHFSPQALAQPGKREHLLAALRRVKGLIE